MIRKIKWMYFIIKYLECKYKYICTLKQMKAFLMKFSCF